MSDQGSVAKVENTEIMMSWEPSRNATVAAHQHPMSEGQASTAEAHQYLDNMPILSNGNNVDNGEDWCDGSIGSVISLGASNDYSSFDSHDDIVYMEDVSCIENLQLSERRGRSLQTLLPQRDGCGPATVVSATSSSPFSTDFDTSENWDYAFDDVSSDHPTFDACFDDDSTGLPLLVTCNDSNVFSMLPDEIAGNVFSYLGIKSLLNARCVSKRFEQIASSDDSGWKIYCRDLWRNKAQVCWRAVHLSNTFQSMEAYRVSYQDGRHRHEISPNELCFDPLTGRGTIWQFRFKKSAGTVWTNLDPWYQNKQPRKMVFLRDGTVWQILLSENTEKQVMDDGEAIPPGSFRLKPALFDATDASNEPNNASNEELNQSQSSTSTSRIDMKWRFVLHPMDLPSRPRGAYVRLRVGGRDVPTYVVRRSPTGNWGFVMENCWGIYASFPIPPRQDLQQFGAEQNARLRRQHQQHPTTRPARIRLRRTSTGIGRWLNVDGIESDSENEEIDNNQIDNNQHNRNNQQEYRNTTVSDQALMEDDALFTTNRCQWREALLYNYGAVSLPEGEAATAEFDRIFRSFRTASTREQPLESMHNFLRRHLQL